MKIIRILVCIAALAGIAGIWHSRGMQLSDMGARARPIGETVVSDLANFYTLQNMALFGAGLGGAALLANTPADRAIRDWYQQNVRCPTTDTVSSIVKNFGDGWYVIPVCFAGVFAGELAVGGLAARLAGAWAGGCIRVALAGAPFPLLFQPLLGASRPTGGSSHWQPFKEDHGVSGHAFMGAIPFLTAAMMASNLPLRIFFYAASTLPGISRINDDAHYFSQAVLGWWIAFLAARSVFKKKSGKKKKSGLHGLYLPVLLVFLCQQFRFLLFHEKEHPR